MGRTGGTGAGVSVEAGGGAGGAGEPVDGHVGQDRVAVDGFRGKIPPQQAGDESAQAGTAFLKGIGGNTDMAASD
ncbi:MAG TPA: hypothetical protein VH257_02520 [Chloroflexota bacterium]|jgi:hypothetical protein|nr:hypothetical protein [Chloroflexota bacterium]